MVDGDLYRLPAPLSAFRNNGWEISSKPYDFVPGKTVYGAGLSFAYAPRFELKRGNSTLIIEMFYNFSDQPMIIENCFVMSLSMDYLSKFEMVLPGGVTVGMAESRLLDLHRGTLELEGEYEGSWCRTYKYDPDPDTWSRDLIRITIDLEDDRGLKEKIYDITITNHDEWAAN